MVYNDKMVHECKSLHLSEVDLLDWSPSGAFLLSGDSDGCLGLWKAAKNGKLVRFSAF